jgi:hypothetical protein
MSVRTVVVEEGPSVSYFCVEGIDSANLVTGKRFADESYFQGMVPALRHFDPAPHCYPNLPCYLIFDQNYATTYSFAGRSTGADIPG